MHSHGRNRAVIEAETCFGESLDLESVSTHLEELTAKTFPKETLRLFRLQAETLRSEIAHLLTGVLHRRESVDWYHFGKQADDLAERLKKIKTVKRK